MKRRITVEQLNELTEEQKQKLREWWKPLPYDLYYRVTIKGIIDDALFAYCHADDWMANNKQYKIPALDIGQMIELLGIELVSCVQYITFAWVVHYKAKEYGAKELTDALWEAVKQVL